MQILDLSSGPSWDGPGYDRLSFTWQDEMRDDFAEGRAISSLELRSKTLHLESEL